ncbi:MAG: hypothetical protein QOG69_2970, partial [Actinomycetota bacterium]|nr:hypothetical protein [Actinomycetota bacterium]
FQRSGGVVLTIKDGVVYDAPRLLDRVKDLVAERRADRPEAASAHPT